MNRGRREYEADVRFDVWMRGGDPDRVPYHRIDDGYHHGVDASDVAWSELDQQRHAREEAEQAAYYARMRDEEERAYREACEAHEEQAYREAMAAAEAEDLLIAASLDSWEPQP